MFSNSPPGYDVLGRSWRRPNKQAIYHSLAVITLMQMVDGNPSKIQRRTAANGSMYPMVSREEYIQQFSKNLFEISKPVKSAAQGTRLRYPGGRGTDDWHIFHSSWAHLPVNQKRRKALILTKRTAGMNILSKGVLERNMIGTVEGDWIIINPGVEREFRADRTGWMDIFVKDIEILIQFWNMNAWTIKDSQDHVRRALRWKKRRPTTRFRTAYEQLVTNNLWTWECTYCTTGLTKKTTVMDHCMSVNLYGGQNAHVPPNIVPSCRGCNGSSNKTDKHLNEEGWKAIEKLFSNHHIVTQLKSIKKPSDPPWSDFFSDVNQHYDGLDNTPAWGPSGYSLLDTSSLASIRKILGIIENL